MMKNQRTRSLPSSPPGYSSFETKRELVEYMLRTSGEPSQCSEEAKRRVSFDPQKTRFAISNSRYSQGSCSRRFAVYCYRGIRLSITDTRGRGGSDELRCGGDQH
jgi:hypothetical protein